MEKTNRTERKWVKVTNQGRKYTIAMGWAGEWQATKIRTTNNKIHAEVIAESWLDGLS